MSKKIIIPLAVIAVVFILTANFSLWLGNNIFNRQAFVDTTVAVARDRTVREATADEFTSMLFEDHPILSRIAEEPVNDVIVGLLGSDAVKPAMEAVAGRLNDLLTAKNPQGVSVDLSGADRFLGPVAVALGRELQVEVPRQLPDRLVIVEKGEIPSIYGWGSMMLWLGPVLGLIGIAILAGLALAARGGERLPVAKTEGLALTIGSAVFILLVLIMRAPVLADVSNQNMRVIVGSVFDAFARTLVLQTLLLAVIGLVPVVVDFIVARWGHEGAQVLHLRRRPPAA